MCDERTDFARGVGPTDGIAVGTAEDVASMRFGGIEMHGQVLAHGVGHGIAVFTGLEALFGDHLDFGASTKPKPID